MKTARPLFSHTVLLLVLTGVIHPSRLPAQLATTSAEREIDRQHMHQIYNALQAYKKQHGRLPAGLSDLVPDFISDPAVFVSPVEVRTGQSRMFAYGDPKLKTSYIYEFCGAPAPSGGIRDASQPATMREWKTLQME